MNLYKGLTIDFVNLVSYINMQPTMTSGEMRRLLDALADDARQLIDRDLEGGNNV